MDIKLKISHAPKLHHEQSSKELPSGILTALGVFSTPSASSLRLQHLLYSYHPFNALGVILSAAEWPRFASSELYLRLWSPWASGGGDLS